MTETQSAPRLALDDSVAIVTGANHGIGAATARKLAESGARVLISYLRIPIPDDVTTDDGRAPVRQIRATASGEDVASQIGIGGGTAIAVEADLTDASTVPALFEQAEAEFGPVDIVINNADYCVPDTFTPRTADAGQRPAQFSPEQFARHAAVNCGAVGRMLGELAARHTVRGTAQASVVNVSTDGSPGFVGEVSYGASKFALESLSRAAALELGPLGIRVNVVAPGPIQTGHITSENEPKIAQATPLRRVGTPDDVADVIRFLCTDHARWLTGQTLYVGGGWRVW
jgi:3-oxoacyl-[acyl-carrier protein] reductase